MSAILLRTFALCLFIQAVKSSEYEITSHPMDMLNVDAGIDVTFVVEVSPTMTGSGWPVMVPVGKRSVAFDDPKLLSPLSLGEDGGARSRRDADDVLYQWRKDGVDIVDTTFKYVGTNTSNLTVLSVNDPDDEGAYSVVIGQSPSCDTSDDAFLSISDCDPLDRPTDGEIEFSSSPLSNGNYTTGTVADYNCEGGLELFGDATRHCLAGGAWSGSEPICSDPCPELSLEGGSITYSSDPNKFGNFSNGTSALFVCTTNGDGLVGAAMLFCFQGLWNEMTPPLTPTCEPITCPALTDPSDGSIDYNGNSPDDSGNYTFAVVATYRCDTGFVLVGGNRRTCTGDGTSVNGAFDGVAPTCDPIQCSELTGIANGTISYNPTGTGSFGFNTEAIHTCDNGFFLSNGSDVRVCGCGSIINGTWSGTAPTCTAITCPALASIANGGLVDYGTEQSPDMNDMLPFGATGNYTCIPEYAPRDGVTVTRTCRVDLNSNSGGSFDGVEAVCVSIMCPDLPDPANGRVTFSGDVPAPFVLATVAIYSCEPGYGLSNTVTRTCVDESDETDPVGTWDGDAPTCSAIQCSDSPDISNGDISYNTAAVGPFSFNTLATHTCDNGYFLSNGSDVRVCEGNDSSTTGMWNGFTPTCTANLPIITSEPSDVLLVVEGANVMFSVTAKGVGLTYQWMNGAGELSDIFNKISGATSPNLTITNVGLSDVSGYSVRVRNSAGDVNSLTANLITTSSYQVTLSGDSDLDTIESSQADILYQVTLSRINGASIQQLPAPVRVSLVGVGTPSNTISEESVDFSIGPLLVTFGPCDPCTPDHLQRKAQLCVKDDYDLEFEHGLNISVDLASTDPAGITAGNPLQITITDDEQSTVGVTFDKANYNVAENSSLTVTGRLTGLTGELQRNFSLKLSVDFSVDACTSADTSDVTLTPADFIINFDAFKNPTFSLIIDAIDDTVFEGFHSFMISLPTDSGYIAPLDSDIAVINVTISDFDVPSVSLNSDQLIVMESDEVASVCATISNVPGGGLDCPIILSLSAAPGNNKSATNGMDYSLPGDFQIEFGSSSLSGDAECVNVTISNDDFVEGKEEFVVTVTSVSQQVELSVINSVTVTIVDNDSATASFSPGSVTVTESDFVNSSVCVVLTSLPAGGALECDVDITLTPLQDTAVLNEDFEYFETVLTIPAGTAVNQPVCVYGLHFGIVDDQIVEDSQSFSVVPSSVSPANTLTVSDSFTVTIQDNDYVGVDLERLEYSLDEGTSQSVCVLFSRQLQRPLSLSSDFEELRGLLRGEQRLGVPGPSYVIGVSANASNTVEPGSVCMSVDNVDDSVKEGNRLSLLRLNSSETAVMIGGRQALFIETANDVIVASLTYLSRMVDESDGAVEVCVQLNHRPMDTIVTATLTTQPLTATEGEDFVPLNVTLVWHYDSPSLTQCVSVAIINDECVEEKEEVFTVSLSTEKKCVDIGLDNQTTFTILDNDRLLVDFRDPFVEVEESAGNVTLCVYICDGVLKRNAIFTFATEDVIATSVAPADFSSSSYKQTFTPDNADQDLCVTINIVDDAIYEQTEQFMAVLTTNDSCVEFKQESTPISILDDDCVTLDLQPESKMLAESEGVVEVCVSLSGELETSVNAMVFTVPGDAKYDDDFSFDTGMDSIVLTFTESGEQCINLSIVTDNLMETSEHFSVVMGSRDDRVKLNNSISRIDIIDDSEDIVVTFGLEEVLLNEGNSGSVCVNITGRLQRPVAITVSISRGSASTGSDHNFPASTSFNFSSSPDTYCISFNTTQDAIYENDETFSVLLDSPDPQIVIGLNSSNSSMVMILDDDEVEFQLVVVDETVCESAASATVCVQLRTDTEREVTASVQPSDLSTQNASDYNTSILTFNFPNPSPADTRQCGSVPIVGDTIVEPCEAFYLNLTSSAERSRIVDDDLPNTVIIYDDEDVDELLLFNDSPQIFGRSLTVDYTISGCAQVLCQVRARTNEFDCSPPTGSLTGQWYQESVTSRRSINRLLLTVVPYCPSQIVPIFEDRAFRTDIPQCSVVFTDQQYEVDPVSGDVTVEWAGTGPTAEVNVDKFTCILPNRMSTDCTSPFVLTGLAPGDHTFTVRPQHVSDSSLPQCNSRRGLIARSIIIRL